MKNLIFITLLGLIVVCCKTPQQTTASSLEVEGLDTPTVWTQSYFKTISLKDSVLFYNSSEIRLEGSFFKQNFFVSNGIVNVIDSINNVSKIVSAGTPGGWIDLKKSSSGEITAMLVSFSKNEATYNFIFNKTKESRNFVWRGRTIVAHESFTLNSKAELIFNGHKYPVTAITTGDCILFFYYNKQVIKSEIKESAPGWKTPE